MPYIDNMTQLTAEIAKDVVNGMDEYDSDEYSDADGLNATEFREINEGDTFESKRDTQTAVCHYALIKRFNFKVDKSCKKTYFVSCIDKNCGWLFHASSIGKTSIFKVRKFNDVHTCSMEDRFKQNQHATSRFIANVVKTKFRNTRSYYGPINIQEDVKSNYGIDIDYHKAWRAKEKVVEEVIGKPSVSYADLPSYLHMVKQTNPGTVTNLKTTDDRYK